MPEELYKDLILIGKATKRFSYIDEYENYISLDIKLKDEIDAITLNKFFDEVYKGTRYFYSIPANQFIHFFKAFLKNKDVINLTPLHKMIVLSTKETVLDEMVITLFQVFLDMFEIVSYSCWNKEDYAAFLKTSQEKLELNDKMFNAEKHAMFVNSIVMNCINQQKNKKVLAGILTKIKTVDISFQARR